MRPKSVISHSPKNVYLRTQRSWFLVCRRLTLWIIFYFKWIKFSWSNLNLGSFCKGRLKLTNKTFSGILVINYAAHFLFFPLEKQSILQTFNFLYQLYARFRWMKLFLWKLTGCTTDSNTYEMDNSDDVTIKKFIILG